LSEEMPVVIPLHPRTRKQAMKFGYSLSSTKNIVFIEPMRYLKFIQYLKKAKLIITDSGGVQVEAAILKTPCVTIRENTEHAFTLEEGRNVLVGNKKGSIKAGVHKMLKAPRQEILQDGLLDGHAAERIMRIIKKEIDG